MKVFMEKVIVVGASSGIGEALVRELASRGARVAAVARRRPELERIAADLPGQVLAYPHDVANFEETPALYEKIVADLGGLDTLIYCAAVQTNPQEGEYDFEKDRRMIEINLLGAMAWMAPVAARFEAARGGTILGISSIAGERGRRGNPGYCTSKAALTAYLEALRNRVTRYGVNVVTVKPGFVDTQLTRGMKGLFWLISAEEAARQALAMAHRGTSASGFVPCRWALIAFIVRHLPSFIFRRLNI